MAGLYAMLAAGATIAYAESMDLVGVNAVDVRPTVINAVPRFYEKVYAQLKLETPVPDLVIYLQAPVETLIERVHRRGVGYEQPIAEHYLARLADAYSRYFYQYDAAPLLIVNSERLNFVDDPEHLSLLLGRIGSMRGRREFFNLAS